MSNFILMNSTSDALDIHLTGESNYTTIVEKKTIAMSTNDTSNSPVISTIQTSPIVSSTTRASTTHATTTHNGVSETISTRIAEEISSTTTTLVQNVTSFIQNMTTQIHNVTSPIHHVTSQTQHGLLSSTTGVFLDTTSYRPSSAPPHIVKEVSTISSIQTSGSILSNITDTLTPFPNPEEIDSDLMLNIHLIITLTFIPFICFGNILILAAVWRYRWLRSATNYLITSLAMSDYLVGLVGIPLYSIQHYTSFREIPNQYLCVASLAAIVLTTGTSLVTLLVISVDRYIAVMFPLKYTSIMTVSRAKRTMAIIWSTSILFSGLPFIWNTWNSNLKVCAFLNVFYLEYNGVMALIMALVLVVSAILHMTVFYKAWRHQHRMSNNVDIYYHRKKKDTHLAKMMFLVMGIFYICWLPFIGFCITELTTNSSHMKMPTYIPHIAEFAFNLALINSCFNPLIYSCMTTDFQNAFIGLILCKNRETMARTISKKSTLSLFGRKQSREMTSLKKTTSAGSELSANWDATII